MKIALAGCNGFVGKSILSSSFFESDTFIRLDRNELNKSSLVSEFYTADVLIYTAGIAHDVSNSISDDEYYKVNVTLLKKIYDEFLKSEIKVFIYFSSVKAVADHLTEVLTESSEQLPISIYGKTKHLAEQYILANLNGQKKVFILRPSMIHGPGNKGNLNLLFKYLDKGLPWLFTSFSNNRSYCSIDNLLYVLKEFSSNYKIPSGIYNVCDDVPLSTNEIIDLFTCATKKRVLKLRLGVKLFTFFAKLGSGLHLKFNSSLLNKLVGSYVIDNSKLKNALTKSLPLSSKDGIIKTFQSFNMK
jgi:nucleoside-diphosphate-sugar epimerase